MDDMKVVAKRYAVYMAVMILALLIAVPLFDSDDFLLGIALGITFSLFNLFSTYRQVKKMSDTLNDSKFRLSLGTLGRLLTVILALVLAIRFPEYFHIYGVIIGLAIGYLILLIEPLFHIKQLQEKSEDSGASNK